MNSEIEIEAGDIISETILEECEFFNVVEQVVQGSVPDFTYKEISIMSKSGEYAGPSSMIRTFLEKHGVAPETSGKESHVCSIGWSEKNHKWYGWSHRAWAGFGIGDKGFQTETKITNVKEARASACAFAEFMA